MVEKAAPNTPQWNTNIKTALPTIFKRFPTALTIMGSRELPEARYSAALTS